MVGLLLFGAVATAAQVECDALAAASLLAEARIEEGRAPVSHPELIPGLALASDRTDSDLRAALTELCAEGATVSLARSDEWEGAGRSAHTFLLTSTETVGCTLYQRTAAISVAVADDTAPRYSLRSRLPVTRTPVGDCSTTPKWREEAALDGERSSVRLVLATDLEDGEVVHSAVLARRADALGWTEQVLQEPAPARLLDGGAGPVFAVTERNEEKWIIAYGDRTGAPPDCERIPGQTVWTWNDRWVPHTGREALLLLAQRGLGRLAGEDGWFVIVTQDDEVDADVLASRTARIQRKSPEPLYTLPSANFPGLNPGFLVVLPAPYSSEEAAMRARTSVPRWRRGYVKQAWKSKDPCSEE